MHIRCGRPQSHIPDNSDEAVLCSDTHNTIEMDRLYWCTPPIPQRSCKLCMGLGAMLDQMRRSVHNLGACSYCCYNSNSSRPKWGQRSPLSDTHSGCTVLSRSLSPQWREGQQQTLQQSGSSRFNGFLKMFVLGYDCSAFFATSAELRSFHAQTPESSGFFGQF